MDAQPLPPHEAEKLIKFYLNLYPDLVGTLKDYFPKQASSEFNRTIKVNIPVDKKSEFIKGLLKEFNYCKWWFEGSNLMMPYHNASEWNNLTKDLRKLARSYGIKQLSFRGLKSKETIKKV